MLLKCTHTPHAIPARWRVQYNLDLTTTKKQAQQQTQNNGVILFLGGNRKTEFSDFLCFKNVKNGETPSKTERLAGMQQLLC